MLEGRQQSEIDDVTVLIWTGLPDYGPTVTVPPDAVFYYQPEDGSIVEEVRLRWEGDRGSRFSGPDLAGWQHVFRDRIGLRHISRSTEPAATCRTKHDRAYVRGEKE